MEFEKLQLKPALVTGLKRLGLTKATEVQEKAVPMALTGTDVIVRSKTGSGKTFAFLLPIMSALTEGKKPQALILAPTRELAQQTEQEIRKLDRQVRTVLLYGGVSINPQIERMARGVQVVIATPGRLLDHIERGTIDLSNIKFAVLDEADRMLDMGFIDDVAKILSYTPKSRQTMLFSATMPDKIRHLAERHMKNPKTLMLQQDEITVKKIRQQVRGMDRKKKLDELLKILKQNKKAKVMVFCNTKSWAERLGGILYRKRFRAASIHSGLSQNKRNKVIESFNSGRNQILVATDVAARGLHIEGVTHVVNYDIPRNPKDYVHRIGRTGRAGKEGDAITFVSQLDQHMLSAVEAEINMHLEIKQIGKMTSPQKVKPMQAVPSAEGDDWGLD